MLYNIILAREAAARARALAVSVRLGVVCPRATNRPRTYAHFHVQLCAHVCVFVQARSACWGGCSPPKATPAHGAHFSARAPWRACVRRSRGRQERGPGPVPNGRGNPAEGADEPSRGPGGCRSRDPGEPRRCRRIDACGVVALPCIWGSRWQSDDAKCGRRLVRRRRRTRRNSPASASGRGPAAAAASRFAGSARRAAVAGACKSKDDAGSVRLG